MKMNSFDIIQKQIQKGGVVSPFLFLSPNLELLHWELYTYILSLLKDHDIDMQSLFHISDSDEAIKIEEIKKLLTHGEIKPRFKFQIFLIENISRMTTQAQNSCLKFFEEPWEGNIIILTNSSESWILDTILSRVQIISWATHIRARVSEFYYDMIYSHDHQQSDELIRYMFSSKLEKWEYIEFLKALIEYISQTWKYIWLLENIHDDINGILKNNFQGKYIADTYIMKLQNAKW